MNEKMKPAHEIKLGRIKAVIWANETEKGNRYNVQLKRIYRVDEKDRGEDDTGWREVDSFGRDDLLQVAKVSDMAHSWMFEHGSKT